MNSLHQNQNFKFVTILTAISLLFFAFSTLITLLTIKDASAENINHNQIQADK
jgi:Na+/alanine symporter